MDYKVTPHPIHKVQDERRRKDLVETLLREIDDNFAYLIMKGYYSEAREKWEDLGISLKLTERLMGDK